MSKNIKLESFKDILTWLLGMRNDDIRSKFCIIKADLLKNTEGKLDVDHAIFLKTFEANMRESDLIARDVDTYWCLLPTDNIEALERRIKDVVKLATQKSISPGAYKIASYGFPRYSLHRVKDGSALLSILKEETGVIPDKQIEFTVTNTGKKSLHVVPLFVS